MYCNICGDRGDSLNIFKINMCKKCFYEIASTSITDENYEHNKNLIRILLSYYISPRAQLNPVN